MFANISSKVMNFAFPDFCKTPTPGGPIPIPYLNVATSSSHVPNVFKVIICGGFAENLMTTGTISTGNEAGSAGGGVLSNVIKGPDQYVTGSLTVMMGGMPAAKITSLTLQNGKTPNAVGVSTVPGQLGVLVLS